MKRMVRQLSSMFLALVLLGSLAVVAAGAAVTATPNRDPILLDGQPLTCTAYSILSKDGVNFNNYFKLRDVAMALRGTPKQFNVTWTGRAIELTRGEPYVSVGGELGGADGAATMAVPNSAPVYLDGRAVALTAYTINQNNYFKLRDLGAALDFGVEWLADRRAVSIRTDVGYTPPPKGEPFDLNVCIAGEPVTMDPTLNSTVDGAIMLQHLFEGLMKWQDDGNGNAILVPGQAEDYRKTVNADGTVTYLFHLRDNIVWSDGRPVTARDFVYAWRRLVDPDTYADYDYMLDMVKGAEQVRQGAAPVSTLAVSAPGADTFLVTLNYDCPYFLEICAFTACLPLREDTVSKYGETWTFDTDHYLTNGPYRLTRWIHNGSIAIEKNQSYYGLEALGPETITFRLMDDTNRILAGYRSGELDFITAVPYTQTATLLASGELKVDDYIGTYYVNFNTQKAPFDDPLVRKAFSLAIDRNYLTGQVTQTGQRPADAFVPYGVSDSGGPSGADFRQVGGSYWDVSAKAADGSDTYAANVAEARSLLAQAGYPEGKGFPVVEYLYNMSDGHKAVAQALQSQWQAALGVKVVLVSQEWSTFLMSRRSGDYDMARNGWIADYDDPTTFLDMLVTGNGNNDGGYSNPDYDALMGKARATTDPVARMEFLHRAEDIALGQDAAVAPLYFYTQVHMQPDDLSGVFYNPIGYFYFMNCTKNG